MAKRIAFLTKFGALLFVLKLQTAYAIQLQLLGGIWIGQTVPTVLLALYVRLNPWGLLAGWALGMSAGTWMAWTLGFKSSTYVLHAFGVAIPCYAALSALLLNLAVAVVVSLIANAISGMPADQTLAEDYV
jgi:SSS family solute:Na+ symporter